VRESRRRECGRGVAVTPGRRVPRHVSRRGRERKREIRTLEGRARGHGRIISEPLVVPSLPKRASTMPAHVSVARFTELPRYVTSRCSSARVHETHRRETAIRRWLALLRVSSEYKADRANARRSPRVESHCHSAGSIVGAHTRLRVRARTDERGSLRGRATPITRRIIVDPRGFGVAFAVCRRCSRDVRAP